MAAGASADGATGPPLPIEFLREAGQSAFRKQIRRIDFSMKSKEFDLVKVLDQFTAIFAQELERALQDFHGFKVCFVVTPLYKHKEDPTNEPFYMYLRTKARSIQSRDAIQEEIAAMNREIQNKNDAFVQGGSQLVIKEIFYLSLFISRFEPLAASGFQALPQFLKRKEAIVNIQNRDNRCFGYAIVCALMQQTSNVRASTLAKFFRKFHLDRIHYPVLPEDIKEIETQLNLKISVFSFFDDQGRGRYPMYISKNEAGKQEIDLLYWGKNDNMHYAWIKSFSRFIADLSPGHCKKYFCKRCFGVFLKKEIYDRHFQICDRPDFDSQILSFSPPGSSLQFSNWRHLLKAPFVIYADFECLLKPLHEEGQHAKTIPYEVHIPVSVALFVVPASSDCDIKPRFETYSGKDVVEWFLNRLLKISEELMPILLDEKRMIMRVEDYNNFAKADSCFICQMPFNATDPLNPKVRDHDHLTGKFRGAAHSNCNLQLKLSHKMPVFIHNFRGYDSHLITLGIEKFPEQKISVIGQGKNGTFH